MAVRFIRQRVVEPQGRIPYTGSPIGYPNCSPVLVDSRNGLLQNDPMRPFENLRVIDATHVLAGPFAAYQLAVLGADVIKVENPQEMDQVREQGPDESLNQKGMGTYYLTQASNKRSITLNLRNEDGKKLFRQMITDADVLLENYRPGAFRDLGLGYESLQELNPRLVYCSLSAYGQEGPKAKRTGYDFQIQATSGLMASTGTAEVNPIKVGPPVVDYATGAMAAFAIAGALFQRTRTGRGQYIDLAMFDVALMLMSADVTNYSRSGSPPVPAGNDYPMAGGRCYRTRDGLLMLGAMNRRQHARLFTLMERPDIAAETDYPARFANGDEQAALLSTIFLTRTAEEWETVLQEAHIPAARVRSLDEALADPQLRSRAVTREFPGYDGDAKPFTVPLAAFKFAHGGPEIEAPPPGFGQDTDEILGEMGYDRAEIARLRRDGTI